MEQIWEVEGVQIQVTSFSREMMERQFEDYPYSEPMDGDFTVDDLIEQRIRPAFGSLAERRLIEDLYKNKTTQNNLFKDIANSYKEVNL